MLRISDLRVCACCGQERNALWIPDLIYLPSNRLFEPLGGDLVLIAGEDIRVCTRCVDVLKTGHRPKHAIRFPPRDARFAEFSALEKRLILPIVLMQTIYRLPGSEGQFATIGGTVSFANDSLRVARRLPRPLEENGGVWVRGKTTTNGQVISEVMVRPDKMREYLADVIVKKHPAFQGIELDENALAALATIDANLVVAPPPDLTEEEEEELEAEEAAEKNEIYGKDSKDVLLMDVPEGATTKTMLEALFGDDAPNIPGEAEAQPGDPGMLTRDALQPTFPSEALVNDFEMGRSFFMRVFPHHFTNGQGGHDQTPDELSESEFIECCLFYHTRQFATDFQFVSFCCKKRRSCTFDVYCCVSYSTAFFFFRQTVDDEEDKCCLHDCGEPYRWRRWSTNDASCCSNRRRHAKPIIDSDEVHFRSSCPGSAEAKFDRPRSCERSRAKAASVRKISSRHTCSHESLSAANYRLN